MYKLTINTSNFIGSCLAHLFSIVDPTRPALILFRLFDLSMTRANSYVSAVDEWVSPRCIFVSDFFFRFFVIFLLFSIKPFCFFS